LWFQKKKEKPFWIWRARLLGLFTHVSVWENNLERTSSSLVIVTHASLLILLKRPGTGHHTTQQQWEKSFCVVL
jgi:hypothetical protein